MNFADIGKTRVMKRPDGTAGEDRWRRGRGGAPSEAPCAETEMITGTATTTEMLVGGKNLLPIVAEPLEVSRGMTMTVTTIRTGREVVSGKVCQVGHLQGERKTIGKKTMRKNCWTEEDPTESKGNRLSEEHLMTIESQTKTQEESLQPTEDKVRRHSAGKASGTQKMRTRITDSTNLKRDGATSTEIRGNRTTRRKDTADAEKVR